jgi:hypothetical protein
VPTQFRGGWLARQFYTDPAEAPLHQADARHMVPDEHDPNPTWYQPAGAPQSGYLEDPYIGLEFVVGDTPGVVFDTTRYDDSSDGYAGDPGELGESDAQNRAEAGAAHAQDQGAARQSNYGGQYAPLTFSDERYINPRFETDGPVELNPLVSVRGFNGQAANSQGAEIRRGWVDQSWVSRRMQAPAPRTHDQRVQTVNIAQSPTDSPPAHPDAFTPYNSPFRTLARAMTRTFQTPMIRRDPPPIDQQLVSDGSEDMYPADDTYVVG